MRGLLCGYRIAPAWGRRDRLSTDRQARVGPGFVSGHALAYNQTAALPVSIQPAEREIVTSVATLDPGLVSALGEAVDVLRSVAELELDDELQQRLRVLGENKEACTADQRNEHRQLADFWRRQTLRKVRALNVLRRLGELAPELTGGLPDASAES
jgi:hypothetical protein